MLFFLVSGIVSGIAALVNVWKLSSESTMIAGLQGIVFYGVSAIASFVIYSLFLRVDALEQTINTLKKPKQSKPQTTEEDKTKE